MELQLSILGNISEPSSVILPPHCGSTVAILEEADGVLLFSNGRKKSLISPFKLRRAISVSLYDDKAGVFFVPGNADQGSEVVAIVVEKTDRHEPTPALQRDKYRILDCAFSNGKLARLACVKGLLRRGWGHVVLAISSNGVVALMRACVGVHGLSSVALFRQVADLDVTQILALDTSTPGYCAIAALRGKRLGIHILRIKVLRKHDHLPHDEYTDTKEVNGDKDEEVLKCELFDVIWAPQPPKGGAKLVGFSVQPQSACILYEGGEIHFFEPCNGYSASIHGDKLDAWRKRSTNDQKTSEHDTKSTKCAESFPETAVPEMDRKQRYNLLQRCRLKTARTILPRNYHNLSATARRDALSMELQATCTGGVINFGDRLCAFGYGRVVSVWDTVHYVGLGYVELPHDIVSMTYRTSTGDAVVVGADGTLFSVSKPASDEYSRANIGLALKYQGACDTVMKAESGYHDDLRVPLHCQPVAMSVIRATSDAGDTSSQIFDSHIKSEEKEEGRRLRVILSQSATPSAQKVSDAIAIYVYGNRAARIHQASAFETGRECRKAPLRGQHGLFRLPSERFAAHVVARCVHEIHSRRMGYIIPLIDMVGTGVVSIDAVSGVLEDPTKFAATNQELSSDVPPSVITSLTTSLSTANALEAVILRVNDLTEADIVRASQFAIRHRNMHLRILESSPASSVIVGDSFVSPDVTSNPASLRGAERLLLRCISRHIERNLLRHALESIPPHDVLALLHYFCSLLEGKELQDMTDFSKSPELHDNMSENVIEKRLPCDYRGRSRWLDEPILRDTDPSESFVAFRTQCMTWLDCIVDAHMTSLIVDDSGTAVLGRLLNIVRIQRSEVEGMTPLIGIADHLQNKLPLPDSSDPLYSQSRILVPSHAALL